MDKSTLLALLVLCGLTEFIPCINATIPSDEDNAVFPRPSDCSSPPFKNNGLWWCDDSKLSCYLNCNPGYASLFSSTTCTNGAWTWTDLDKMECLPSVFLLLGGRKTLEIYHRTVDNLTCSNPQLKPDSQLGFHTSTFKYNGLVYMFNEVVCKSLNLTDQFGQWKHHNISSIYKHDYSTVVIQNKVYFIGGYRGYDGGYVESVWTTLPLDNEPVFASVPNLSYRGLYQCVVKISQDSFVITGVYYDGSPSEWNYNGSAYTSVTKYNVTEQRSYVLPQLLEGRDVPGCILVEEAGKQWIVVAGGYNNGGYLRPTERLDLNGGTQWESLGQLNVPRNGHGMIQTDMGIMVIGGWNRGDLNSVEMLDWYTKKWKIDANSLEYKRSYFGQALEVQSSVFNCDIYNESGKIDNHMGAVNRRGRRSGARGGRNISLIFR